MVEYADFHVLIATLSPVFFLAGLFSHFRAGAERTGFLRWLIWLLVVVTFCVALLNMTYSLAVLSGAWETDLPSRKLQVQLFIGQVLVGVAGACVDAWNQRRLNR